MPNPTLQEIMAICTDKNTALAYLVDQNVLHIPENCPVFGGNISLKDRNNVLLPL